MSGQLMALKDLSISLNKIHDVSQKNVPPVPSLDIDIACDVVDHIFRCIDLCLKENKSKYQLSLFTKSFIRGVLTDNVKGGINNFIRNMNNEDVKAMLNDIQKELNKRKLDGR